MESGIALYLGEKDHICKSIQNRRYNDLLGFDPKVSVSHSVVSDSFWPHRLQHARLPGPPQTLRAHSNSCPSSRWCHPTISSSVVPFSCFQSFPASESFQWVSSSHQVAKILELQLQHHSFQWIFRTDVLWDWLIWSPCSPRDSQESSTTL